MTVLSLSTTELLQEHSRNVENLEQHMVLLNSDTKSFHVGQEHQLEDGQYYTMLDIQSIPNMEQLGSRAV